MDKTTVIISMPKGSTEEEVLNMREKYQDKYKVFIVISGNENPKENIKNFLKARLET